MKSTRLLAYVLFCIWNTASNAQVFQMDSGSAFPSLSTATVTVSTVKTLEAPFFGLNTKNIGNGNFMADINVLATGWKRTHARIYRYPGGTFGNSFDWHTGTTIIGGRPPEVNPPVRPADVAEHLPQDTDILWMANIRVPTPATGFDWRVMTREKLLSEEVLQAKIRDIVEGLQSFKNAGREVKYLELGNEFYFSKDEGPGEIHGAGGDNPYSDFQGDHFPYDKNPADYIAHMTELAKEVKARFPDIKIAVIKQKMEAGNQAVWNNVIDEAFQNNADLRENVDAVVYHWYQNEKWYDSQQDILPPVTDLSAARNSLGMAFDYFSFKEENDLKNIPEGKAVWVTEGDIKDPGPEGTWLEAIRESLVNVHYILMPGVTMYTPQIFQPNYIDTERLELTMKGRGADMIYAAAEDMLYAEKINLGGNVFFSDFGGPYPELTGIKLSDGARSRIVLINASENHYANIHLTGMVEDHSVSLLSRYNPDAWQDGYQQIRDHHPNPAALVLNPFSITILAEESLVSSLEDVTVDMVNPSSDFPERRVSIYRFGEIQPGNTMYAVLAIRNMGPESISLSAGSVSLETGSVFDFEPLNGQILPNGGQLDLTIRFSPENTGFFTDKLTVQIDDQTRYECRIEGIACYFCNMDFEKGHDVGWHIQTKGEIVVEYDQASLWHTAKGEISGRVHVIYGVRERFEDAELATPVIPVDPAGNKLTVRIQAKSDPAGSEVQMSLLYFNEVFQETGKQLSDPIPIDDTYRHIEFTGDKIPEGSVYYKILLGCGNQTGNYYFDNLETIPVSEVNHMELTSTGDIRVQVVNRCLLIGSELPVAFRQISIFSLTGGCMLIQPAIGPSTRHRIDLPANWPGGMYIVHLEEENGPPSGFSKKVIIF